MKIYYQLTTPDEVQAELIITGTVGDFKAWLNVINQYPSPDYWPQGKLREAIQKVISTSLGQVNQELAKEVGT